MSHGQLILKAKPSFVAQMLKMYLVILKTKFMKAVTMLFLKESIPKMLGG